MSIKIWEAYRCPLARINDAILWFDQAQKQCAIDLIEKTMRKIIDRRETINMPVDKSAVVNMAKNAYEKLGGKAWIDVLIWNDFAYFIPSDGRYEDIPAYLVDYHYQNQTDRPEDISESDWDARSIVWKEILAISEKIMLNHASARDDYQVWELLRCAAEKVFIEEQIDD